MRVSVRIRRVSCALLAACALAMGCGDGAAPGRVVVLGLDGMDPEAVDLLMSEGRLPNFARLRQEGAYARLLSSKPLLSPVLWTTIATLNSSPGSHCEKNPGNQSNSPDAPRMGTPQKTAK